MVFTVTVRVFFGFAYFMSAYAMIATFGWLVFITMSLAGAVIGGLGAWLS